MRIYLTHRKLGDITGSSDEIGPKTSLYQSTLLPLLPINSLAVVVKNPLALAFYSILSSDEDQVE